ncbi:MAG: class I SAM-dependent methyltransferase [bacterium]
MSTEFYDKVAKKFGGYAFGHNDVKLTSEYPNGDPEAVFKEKIIDLINKDVAVLDVGCGDGKFAFGLAEQVSSITGIDLSEELLRVARQKKEELKVNNIDFELQDASKTSFPDNSYDLAFSRRGPTPFLELYRILNPGGYFVGINIGEKDCQEIKEVFGRGQGFGEWNSPRIEKDRGGLESVSFEIIFAQDYLYDEYYESYEDIDLFLQGVPIFEDFDSERDKELLEKYVASSKTDKGIRLPRHRIVVVARKPLSE